MITIPEIEDGKWFNARRCPSFRNKVVLVDFFSYSCANCVRTMPYLRRWWNWYKDHDFVMIGIHTPEFEFEKDPSNVKQALADLEIEWPVVMDNDRENWENFANKYWPAKYIADKSGKLVYEHFGEGAYEKTEKIIQKLLGDEGLPEITKEKHGDVCFRPTPELYCGYHRGQLNNVGGHFFDTTETYELPDRIDSDSVALKGSFYADPEYVESREDTSELFAKFHALEVNLVIHPIGETVIKVKFDHQSIPDDIAGDDVKDSELIVDRPRMYNLLKADHSVKGTLSLRPIKGNFQAFAFTFSGCN